MCPRTHSASQQWRHAVAPEDFAVEIHFDDSETEVSGFLECRIHAENLSDVIRHGIPVRITVQRKDTLQAVKNRIDVLKLMGR